MLRLMFRGGGMLQVAVTNAVALSMLARSSPSAGTKVELNFETHRHHPTVVLVQQQPQLQKEGGGGSGGGSDSQ